MNVKTLAQFLNTYDFAKDGNTSVEVVTSTGAVKQIQKVGFSARTGAIQIIVK